MDKKEFFINEPVVASLWIGEFGWAISRWFGYLRHLKHNVYKDHKFLIMMDLTLQPLVNDFIDYTIDLPKEFKELHLETDCTEAPLPNSPPGSLTPPNVYAALLEYLRHFYASKTSMEALPPRGPAFRITDSMPQVFCKLETDKIKLDKPIICVFPRARTRSAQRNVPEFIWRDLIDKLVKNNFIVVLGGTPKGAGLADYANENVINLIGYEEEDKTFKIIQYLNSAICSISSQSGSTHLSLNCDCPSYIIGHEDKRHTVDENRLDTPTSFRYVTDYRAIDADTIIEDVRGFLVVLEKNGYFDTINSDTIVSQDINIMRSLMHPHEKASLAVLTRPSLFNLLGKENLVGAEIGTYRGVNAYKILQNLSITKLYMIDPYDASKPIAGMNISQDLANILQREVYNTFSIFGEKIKIINKTSIDALTEISEELDFVYIDGAHSYENVKKELELYYPKIKKGGLLAGHDYDEDPNANGVKQAVQEFSIEKRLPINIEIDLEDSYTKEWWVIKDRDNE